MKLLKLGVALFAFLMIFSCRSQKGIITEYKRDSVYIQKLAPVSLPADSSIVKALLQCDASGSVLLSRLSIETTKNAHLSLLLDSLGNIHVQTIVKHDTLYLPTDSIYINNVRKEFVNIPVEIPLSGWQSFFLKFGRTSFWVVVGFLVCGASYLFFKVKK